MRLRADLRRPWISPLRSLEGTLVVADGNPQVVDFAADELKRGAEKQVGDTTVRLGRVQFTSRDVQIDLTVTRQLPQFIASALGQHFPPDFELSGLAIPRIRAEVRDGDGHVYEPSAMISPGSISMSGGGSSSSSSSSSAATHSDSGSRGASNSSAGAYARSGAGSGDSISAQSENSSNGSATASSSLTVRMQFQLPAGQKRPSILRVTVFGSTGHVQRIPFKFTNVPVTQAQ